MASFDFASLFVDSLSSFPGEWFQKNPGEKPSVDLPAMDCSLDNVRSTVKHFLLNKPSHRLDPDLVLLYFRKLTGSMKARLEEDWTSFGVTIGKAGSEVGPLDIVDVKDRAIYIKLKLKPAEAAGPEYDLPILMALAALYHHSTSAAGNRKDSGLSLVVQEQWKTSGFEATKLGKFWKANTMLTSCPSYAKMMAVFDMFLFKFPDHSLSAARNLTSVSRFQGCAAYQSLSRLSKLLNKDFREIQKWMWTAPLQKEYLTITRSGQELDQPYSYAPYCIALQLSPLSPYSEDANPCVYLFTNIVSATMNDPDARCARMPEKTVLSNVPINAFVFAYTLTYGGEQIDGLPEGKDFAGWFKWFSANHSGYRHSYMDIRPPKAIIEKLARIWSAFGQDRPGTIGAMLYELIFN